MTALPIRPAFIDTEPQTIQDAMVALFESTTGRELEPAQVERMIVSFAAYRETLFRMGVQLAAEKNLVAFSTGTALDALGALDGVTRLVNRPATCTLRFTLSVALGTDTTIPAGTRAKTSDGVAVFATDSAIVIAAGQTTGDVDATATVVGSFATGYAASTVTTLMDPVAGVASVRNTTTTVGGCDTETDDALRYRITQAPYRYGTAGSYGAYRFHALSVGAWMVDANVTSPSGGNVQVAVLTNAGAPSAAQITAVETALTDDTVRPITDNVTVVAANPLTYEIEAALTVYATADQASVLAAANAAAQAYVDSRLVKLGIDVTPAQVQAALYVPGVYDLTLTHPASSVVAGDGDYCDCSGITITIAGTANG